MALPPRELTTAVETERSAWALGAIPVFSPFQRDVVSALASAVQSVEQSRATEQGTPTTRTAPVRPSARTRYSRRKSESVPAPPRPADGTRCSSRSNEGVRRNSGCESEA